MKTLSKTQSICAVCKKPINAFYVVDGDCVYLEKKCGEHGTTRALVAENLEEYLQWTSHTVINIPPLKAITKGKDQECPLHCGTCDQHLQTACCVLLDVTERCNQVCKYCFARANENVKPDPSLQTIEKWYDKLVELGEERPFNIQISGGEPTVREDLPDIISMGKQKGFEYIQLNTNGKRIAEEANYAKKLKEAGVSVVFLQFDGTTDEIYMALRGEPLLETKKRAIVNCKKAGIPVTLVPTVVKNVNLNNIGSMVGFLLQNLDVIKGIHFQPVSFFGRHPDGEAHGEFENRVTMFETIHEIEAQTKGLFQAKDLYPISTGHSLCCFCGSFLKEMDGKIKSLIGEKSGVDGISCCDTIHPLDVIKKDRDFVLNKWDLPAYEDDSQSNDEEPYICCGWETEVETECCEGWKDLSKSDCCCDIDEDALTLDEILVYLKSNMFTISGMAFQDLSNLDAERLKRCRVQVFTPDERLIPFCAYNSLYRS